MNEIQHKQQMIARRTVNFSLFISAWLYVVIAYILIVYGSEGGMETYRSVFAVLLGAVFISSICSGIVIYQRWRLDEHEDYQKVIRKDVVLLALCHIPSLLGLLYFILQFVEII